MMSEAQPYVRVTLERFQNPFLEHRLADIAQNHAAKVRNRIAAFLDWVRRRDPSFAAARLDAMLAGLAVLAPTERSSSERGHYQ
jgi:tagaturonate reductase